MTKGFKDKDKKFHPTESPRKRATKFFTQNPNLEGLKNVSTKQATELKERKIRLNNLSMNELQDHPSFEKSEEWLDVFSDTPEMIVYDDKSNIFHIWFGGESHYVHQYTPDGHEFDVFSFGFEKNRLELSEVLEVTERHLGEDEVDEE